MTYNDVLNFCEEQDVRFIRLSYFDMYGTQKNVSVLPTELKRAFVEGISFDASAMKCIVIYSYIQIQTL